MCVEDEGAVAAAAAVRGRAPEAVDGQSLVPRSFIRPGSDNSRPQPLLHRLIDAHFSIHVMDMAEIWQVGRVVGL